MILAPPVGKCDAFAKLCEETTKHLNVISATHQFQGGTALEEEVFKAAQRKAEGTPFENKLLLISGQNFPDIKVGENFGIEVKSSMKGWKTVGGSVLESSRIESVKKIFLIYGKLSNPIEFRTRPYEACLSDILVTHSPRYSIDMELHEGDTIFKKMNQSYDYIRKLDNPISPFIEYKRKHNQNSHYWWLPDESIEETAAPAQIQFFSQLDQNRKQELIVEAMLLFPIVFSKDSKKYNSVATYWITKHSILCTNIRDLFSAGGQVQLKLSENKEITVSKIVFVLYKARNLICKLLKEKTRDELLKIWGIRDDKNIPLSDLWKKLVLDNSSKSKNIGMKEMMKHFFKP